MTHVMETAERIMDVMSWIALGIICLCLLSLLVAAAADIWLRMGAAPCLLGCASALLISVPLIIALHLDAFSAGALGGGLGISTILGAYAALRQAR